LILADGFDNANYILLNNKGRKGNMSIIRKINIPMLNLKWKKEKKTLNVFVAHCHKPKT